MMTVRVLEPSDQPAVEAFLSRHPTTTMFLRGNLQMVGIVDRGERLQGTYAAAFDDGAIVGVAAHYWNGNIVLQAPAALPEVVSVAKHGSGRKVHGIIGPYEQVTTARTHLGMDDTSPQFFSKEILYVLELDALRPISGGDVRCRRARLDDIELLLDWKVLYSRETLNVSASPGLRESLRDGMRDRIERGHQWVLEADGRPVAKTSFNAAVATWVQVGGVFTPPDLRSRGYGRAVVAASLEDARAEGATNAVLFTTADNHAAQRAYEAIGFRAIGHYGLLVFSG